MNRKTTFTLVLINAFLGALLLSAPTGCVSSGSGGGSSFQKTVTPQRVEAVARLASYSTAKIMLAKDPKNIETLAKISTGLNELVASKTWDIGSAVAIANANGLNELVSSEGQIALSTVPLFIDLIAGDTVDLKKQEYAQAVVIGAADGFKMALAGPATPAGAASGVPMPPTPATQMRRLQAEAAATLPR